MRARDIMQTQILAAHADWSLSRLADFLVQNGISGVPVLAGDDKVIGVVSLSDIVKHESLPVKAPKADRAHTFYRNSLSHDYADEDVSSFRFGERDEVLVRDFMTPMVFEVTEDTPVTDIASTMVRGHIHRVFVTREGRLVGIITSLDMLKLIREN